jgi:UDP-N-acetylmuramoyl-tripeptide--D-alanyl-D-alanine ligase
MTFWAPDNLCHASGGRWLRRPPDHAAVGGVGIDSREDLMDRVFVAIRGDRHDGHDHVADAVDAGADLVVVHDERAGRDAADNVGVILVDDTRRALARLAVAYRQRLAHTVVIAVTGSVGKTTVKMMIDRVLSTSLRGRAAPRSFNNDIGVPLTILGADPMDEYVVVEIGASRPGEVARLARIARPNIGVITAVARAHLEGFGSAARVADEKAQLLRYLGATNRARRLAVIIADVPRLRDHCRVPETVMLFGEAPDADLVLTDTGAEGGGWWFEVNGEQRFRLGLPGRHNAINALAAVAVARRLWIDDQLIDDALGDCRPVDMRMTRDRINGVTVYNDAYNANPDSMIAALETFEELAAHAPRRVVVLGDMLELGPGAPELHREIGRRVVELDRRLPLERVVLVGDLARHIAEPMAGGRGRERVTHLRALDRRGAAAVSAALEPGDAVLLKGSRAMGLERLVDAIRDAHAPGSDSAAAS